MSSNSTDSAYPIAPIDYHLGGYYGAFLVGEALGGIIIGASLVQFYKYIISYWRQDTLALRCFVLFVVLLNTTSQALNSYAVYFLTIIHWGDLAHLPVIIVPERIVNLFPAIITALVQGYMVYRAWSFSKQNLLGVLLLAMVTALFVLQMVYISKVVHIETFAGYESSTNNLVTLYVTTSILMAVNDVTIAAVMIYFLHKAKTGFSRTQALLNRCIIYTVNSGLMTAVCALLTLITSFAPSTKNSSIQGLFIPLAARFYVTSLLGILNSRQGLRATMKHGSSTTSRSQNGNETGISISRSVAFRVDTEDTAVGGEYKMQDFHKERDAIAV